MKPRIAVIGPSWPFRSGIAQHTTLVAKELHEREQLAGFYVPYRQYPQFLFPGKRDKDGTVCEHLEFAEACYSPFEPWSWLSLLRKVTRDKPDAILIPFWTSAMAPFHLFLIAALRIPVIAILHNGRDHEKRLLSVISLLFNRVAALFFH
jgi:hypothetical protein